MSVFARLSAAWSALCGQECSAAPGVVPDSAPAPASGAAHSAALENALLDARAEAARQRLAAEECEQTAATLRRELEAERAGRSDAIAAAVQSRIEAPLTDAAATIGQLALQARLIEEGQPITARDVMALAQNLSRACAALGLEPAAAVGDAVPFDPALHQPLGGPALAPGAAITIRIPGCRLGGRLVKKSFVQPA